MAIERIPTRSAAMRLPEVFAVMMMIFNSQGNISSKYVFQMWQNLKVAKHQKVSHHEIGDF